MRKGTKKQVQPDTEISWQIRLITLWVHPETKATYSRVWLLHAENAVSPLIQGLLQRVDNGAGKTQMFGLNKTQALAAIAPGRTLVYTHPAKTDRCPPYAPVGKTEILFYG